MSNPVPSTAVSAPAATPGWPRALCYAAAALVLFKLWLVAGQTLTAPAGSGHDDRLFLKLAAHILQGEWLGPYTHRTLAKGPFYSIFIATVFVLGVPLFAAKHVLYAAACALIVRALRPLHLGVAITFILFVVLLFNPVTYDSSHNLRVLRQTLLPLLSLLILAGVAGLAARHDAAPRRQLPWALLLGCTLSVFWITREESVWITPLLAAPAAWLAWRAWQSRAHRSPARLAVLLLPFILWPIAPLTVATLNHHHYGAFNTCEFKEPAFKAAYGSLTRVTPANWHPYIPVARETRERIYAVSPAFALLRPHLEGEFGTKWTNSSQYYIQLPPDQLEIGGGHFMWALRECVHEAGLAPDSASALAYYARLAAEVNAACADGRLDAGPPRATMLPPLVPAYYPRITDSIARAFTFSTTLDKLRVNPRPSGDTLEKRAFFADLTRMRLSPAKEDPPSFLIAQPILDRIRLRILDGILTIYRTITPYAAALGVVAWLATFVFAARHRHLPLLLPLGLGVLGSAIATVLIAALVDATSFQAIHSGYLSGFYGLYFLLIVLAWPALRTARRSA